MIGALLLLAAAAAADENCGDLPQQPMNQCFYRAYERADAEMAAQWKLTAAAMKQADRDLDRTYDKDPGYFDTLLAGQRAWLTYRDQQCLSASFEARGGSLAPTLNSTCRITLTQERTRQLKALVEVEN
ncbi:DUF1311 domain-containing protein [Novosphingobium sp. G106]|uniref:lysozyme inhibitor LprI family protein n=1 Tax=Novosphingobium sp. G106 TaxID=2849500 RepID=UPI001C2D6676|nr:lysozyme inhibitor LprI family protein [Novosphingobium sp. G106]MBV1687014.1 DUF1311 domain-containing protein [Novosphingobium sp. G106]